MSPFAISADEAALSSIPSPSVFPSADTLEWLGTLIGFDTTSRESNLGLIETVRDYLQSQGVRTSLTYDSAQAKANLFATLGEGPGAGLVLSGHTDAVPVDGQAWSFDPFRATVRDGRVYGRGSCDMKGFIACALASVPRMKAAASSAPFHLALSYDEEVGCIGVRHLLADLAERGIRPAGCIVGEPTRMDIVVAHKGRKEMRCCVRGKEAHSSLPEHGVNAIEYAARLVSYVQRLASKQAQLLDEHHAGFDVAYTTLQCGTIKGGIAPNTIPADCEFSVEMRYLPGASPHKLFDAMQCFGTLDLLPRMRQRHAGPGIDWHLVNDTPAFEIAEDHVLVQRVRELVGRPRITRVAYNTEAGLFQQSGIPTLICGPGDIQQAHRPDEFIELAQLAACERFLAQLATS